MPVGNGPWYIREGRTELGFLREPACSVANLKLRKGTMASMRASTIVWVDDDQYMNAREGTEAGYALSGGIIPSSFPDNYEIRWSLGTARPKSLGIPPRQIRSS